MTTLIALCSVWLFAFAWLAVITAERRYWASLQYREGPSVAGVFGGLQTSVDGAKAFLKVIVVSRQAVKFLFFFLPLFLLVSGFLRLLVWPISRFGGNIDFAYDVLVLYVLASADVWAFVSTAWSVFSSKFPTVSALREIAQVCAFDLILGFCILSVVALSGSLSIRSCIEAQNFVWFVFVLTPYAYFMFMCSLSELHRAPFDLLEAESELTAGYQSEYAGIVFSLFYLAEYSGAITTSMLFVMFFCGGWYLPLNLGQSGLIFTVKLVAVLSTIFIIRGASPRVRLESMLQLSWTHYMPSSISFLPAYMWVGYIFNSFRPSEYRLFKDTRRIIWRFGSAAKERLWFKKPTEYDVRLDTAVAAFLFPKSPNIGAVDVMSQNRKLNSPSVLSDIRYPRDMSITKALWIALTLNKATDIALLSSKTAKFGGMPESDKYLGGLHLDRSNPVFPTPWNFRIWGRVADSEMFSFWFDRSRFNRKDLEVPDRLFISRLLNSNLKEKTNGVNMSGIGVPGFRPNNEFRDAVEESRGLIDTANLLVASGVIKPEVKAFVDEAAESAFEVDRAAIPDFRSDKTGGWAFRPLVAANLGSSRGGFEDVRGSTEDWLRLADEREALPDNAENRLSTHVASVPAWLVDISADWGDMENNRFGRRPWMRGDRLHNTGCEPFDMWWLSSVLWPDPECAGERFALHNMNPGDDASTTEGRRWCYVLGHPMYSDPSVFNEAINKYDNAFVESYKDRTFKASKVPHRLHDVPVDASGLYRPAGQKGYIFPPKKDIKRGLV